MFPKDGERASEIHQLVEEYKIAILKVNSLLISLDRSCKSLREVAEWVEAWRDGNLYLPDMACHPKLNTYPNRHELKSLLSDARRACEHRDAIKRQLLLLRVKVDAI